MASRLRSCEVCRDVLPRGARSDRRFCSNACRVKAHRDGQKAEPASWDTPNGEWFDWCEATLKVPAGILSGKPFVIPDWQRQFFEGATAPGIREAGLSVARKNGKSGIIAAYCLAHLCGPLNKQNWRALVTSMTGNLAKELRQQIQEIAEASGLGDDVKVYRSPAPGRIEGQNGARMDFLAADKASGHASGGDLVLVDEGGLLQENQRHLWQAMFSAISGRDGRFMVISIQGDGPMFKELRERADETSVYFQLHAADVDGVIDDPEQWAKANPGLGSIKSLSYMQDASRRAKLVPSDAGAFRAHDLNLPQAPGREMLCTQHDWQRLIVAILPERQGPVVIGLDLGGSASMTAAALYWPLSGRLECYGAFPDDPPLAERGAADGCGGLYVEMERLGELRTFPGRVTPVDEFLLHLADRVAGSDSIKVVGDGYRRSENLQVLDKLGAGWHFELRKGGAYDGAEDVRTAQKEIYEGVPKTLENLMLESAIAESSIERDRMGNGLLSMAHRRGRIDAIQATVLALAAGRRLRSELEGRRKIRIGW